MIDLAEVLSHIQFYYSTGSAAWVLQIPILTGSELVFAGLLCFGGLLVFRFIKRSFFV